MPPLLGYLSAGVALVAFLGTAFVYLRGSADKGTIESLQRSNAAQEQELEVTNRKVATLDAEVKTLRAENSVLRDAVSHVDEVRQLQHTLDEHHTESISALNRIAAAMEAA